MTETRRYKCPLKNICFKCNIRMVIRGTFKSRYYLCPKCGYRRDI
jgi:DNA-directed RNA polymerase subunit RPC12/RpoP